MKNNSVSFLEKETSKKKLDDKDGVINKGNERGLTQAQENCENIQYLEQQISLLERQLVTSKQDNEALSADHVSICKHNNSPMAENNRVKIDLKKKCREFQNFKKLHTHLISKTLQFRRKVEKDQEDMSLNYKQKINKLSQKHSKNVANIKSQFSKMSTTNAILVKRNEYLEKMLNQNKEKRAECELKIPHPAASHIPCAIKGELMIQNLIYQQQLNNQERQKESSIEISKLKAEIRSLRDLLETKTSKVVELSKIHDLYVMMSGMKVIKNCDYYDCKMENVDQKVNFSFSLTRHNTESSVLFEKNVWDSSGQCPGFLEQCSGNFFDCRLAPLFLKNMITVVFSSEAKLT